MKSRSPLPACGFTLLISLCLLTLLGIILLVVLPARVEQAFGPPTPRLGTWQRLYLTAWLALEEQALTTPPDAAGAPRPFQVHLGESVGEIARRLQAEGLIRNAEAFGHYLAYSGLDTSLQAGSYTLSPGMSAVQIARQMQDATPDQVKFVILAGWRMEEIAAALPTSGLVISPEDFLAAAREPAHLAALPVKLPPGASLEGFFFPDTYQFPRDLTLNEMLQIVVENFARHLTPELQQGFEQQGLDVYAGVTLASIIQREAITPDEMPIIASVFLNRLRANMKLDSDPTVQYALGFNVRQNTWWTNPLSLEDLQVDSPYNTYRRSGLPPGPISNPGLQALLAVAFPAETSYYYFRAACDGSNTHVFSETFSEHLQQTCP